MEKYETVQSVKGRSISANTKFAVFEIFKSKDKKW